MSSLTRLVICSWLVQTVACIGGGTGGVAGDGDGDGGGDGDVTVVVIGDGDSGGDGDGDISGDGDGDGDIGGDGDGDGDGDTAITCATDAGCNDAIGCTVDSCDNGTCVFVTQHAACDDGSFCNGVEVCDAATGCEPGIPPLLSDGVDCTLDTCDEDSDQVLHGLDHAACDNGAYCDGAERCDAVADCIAGTPPNVDDGIPCTADTCDEVNDRPAHAVNDALCNNGQYCDGTERCDVALGCIGGPPPGVSDGIACTIDTCDEVNDRPAHAANNSACNNGLYCDGSERCDLALGCTPGAAPGLDDGDPCTNDSCDEANDVIVHVPGLCGNEACSVVATRWCESKGWTVVPSPLTPEEAGNVVCTIDGRDYGNNCDDCSTYNIIVWENGSAEQGCQDNPSSTQAGTFYSAHTPCECGDNLDACGQWNMQGCVPDGVRVVRNVLIAAADIGGATEVQTDLIAAGAFDNVEVLDAASSTPTLGQLLAYDAVLTFSNYYYFDPAEMGDVLADYVEQGGHVVVASFAHGLGYALEGRFAAEYALILEADYSYDGQSLGAVAEPGSPLMVGVNTLTAPYAYRTIGPLHPSAVVVASWTDATPLIVRGTVNGYRRVDLNHFPPPSSSSGDGTQMIINALHY